MKLFREEVLASQTDQLYGDMVISVDLTTWMLAASAVIFIFVVITYLVLGTYTKRATVSGILAPTSGVIRVMSPIDGTVTECKITEGEKVHKGDPLFTIADERRLPDGNRPVNQAVEAQIVAQRIALELQKSKEIQIGQETVKATRLSLLNLQSQLEQLTQETELYKQRKISAETSRDRYASLIEGSFVSQDALHEKDDELTDAKARLAASERSLGALSAQILTAQSELRLIPERTASRIAELDRMIQELQQTDIEITSKDHVVVTAPEDGVISAILVQSKQPVGSRPLALLLPAGDELEAQLYVSSRSIGFVSPGQKVRLRYQAYPYQKFGQYTGTVTAVGRSQIAPQDMPPTIPTPIAPLASEGFYKISVKLDSQKVMAYGKYQTLMTGMIFEADIQLDTRRLIEWILEPLFSIKGRA